MYYYFIITNRNSKEALKVFEQLSHSSSILILQIILLVLKHRQENSIQLAGHNRNTKSLTEYPGCGRISDYDFTHPKETI